MEGGDPADDTTGGEPEGIGLDELFGVLKNRRRRGVLRYLAWQSGPVSVGDLAEWVAARECDTEVSQIGSKERKRVYVALYQCHLPKMADVGAITYDRRAGTVERGPYFPLFREYLPEEEGPIGPGKTRDGWVGFLLDLAT